MSGDIGLDQSEASIGAGDQWQASMVILVTDVRQWAPALATQTGTWIVGCDSFVPDKLDIVTKYDA